MKSGNIHLKKLRNHILNIVTSIILENVNNAKCSKHFLWAFVKFVDRHQFKHLIKWKNINEESLTSINIVGMVNCGILISILTHIHARMHARTHAHTHTHTHKRVNPIGKLPPGAPWIMLMPVVLYLSSFITQKYLIFYSSVWFWSSHAIISIACWFNSIFCCNMASCFMTSPW